MWGQLSTSCSNATEVAQWGIPSCSRPQPATGNDVWDGRSNWLAVTPTLHRAVPPELHVLHGVNVGYKSQDMVQLVTGAQRRVLGYAKQRTASATTQGRLHRPILNIKILGRILKFFLGENTQKSITGTQTFWSWNWVVGILQTGSENWWLLSLPSVNGCCMTNRIRMLNHRKHWCCRNLLAIGNRGK